MDLHVVAPLASPAERAAVEAVIGARVGPPTTWQGGERASATDGHLAHAGHAARGHRDLLLPALHALQERVGYVSQPGLGYVCRRLSIPPAEAYGVASFYALLATAPRSPVVAHVCDDIACHLAGAEDVCAAMTLALGPAGEPGPGGHTTWSRSPCIGQCERAPAALLTSAGESPMAIAVAPLDAAGLLKRVEAAAAGRPVGPDAGDRPWGDARQAAIRASVPQAGSPGLALLARVGVVDPGSLEAYRASGGYAALARALALGPERVVEEVTAARLVGRGGAAFPTGRKWAAVAAAPAEPHYLVCNADESEPGTFKDRILLEEDPFAVVEAMTIAALATGAAQGYLYLRGEYPLAAARVAHAIAAARVAGLLGRNVMDSSFSFDIELRRGAGAYICGEETALFESIEGGRGEPRNKPPFPVEVGLFGRPTTVNNVETLANVLPIVLHGGATFAAIGTAGSTGPKLFCVSGHVARPGLYEVPFGTTLRSLLDLAGGVASARARGVPRGPVHPEEAIRAILLGGAAGVFVGPEALDVPLTFEDTRAIGATLGSGVVMVFDRATDLVATLRRIAAFFRDESCGQCVPCRVGTVRQEELLERLAERPAGAAAEATTAVLHELGQAMRDASICGLGQTASSAIESALRRPDLWAS